MSAGKNVDKRPAQVLDFLGRGRSTGSSAASCSSGAPSLKGLSAGCSAKTGVCGSTAPPAELDTTAMPVPGLDGGLVWTSAASAVPGMEAAGV